MAGYRARQVAVALTAATTVTVYAQQQPPPTFRSDINYVQMPARVLDARGNFVAGLTRSDFTILEDGVPQTIATFTAVEIPFVPVQPAAPDTQDLPIEPDAADGEVDTGGRVYVFVLDNQSMPAWVALRTRHVLRGFIRDHLSANDLAAIVLTGRGRGQSFTRNRRLLDAAIERLLSDADRDVAFAGSMPRRSESGDEPASHRILNVIADTADRMASINDRGKALVLITPGPICGLFQTPSAPEPSSCAEGARHALRRTMMAGASIYTIDPRGAVPTSGAPAQVADPGESARWPVIARGPFDAARYLAEESGGFAIVNSNSLSAAFARIAREQSSYYLLGYYSTNDWADGKVRRNRVAVSRTGLRVVHRGTYAAPRDRMRP